MFRDDLVVGRLTTRRIERVVLVHGGPGASPGDLVHAVVELDVE